MKQLLIIYHAPSDNTQALVKACQGEGGSEAVELVTRPALMVQEKDVQAADAVILATTENLGYMSGALKDFFDRTYYFCREHTQAMPFTYYIRAGLDGTGTDRAIRSITQGMRWKLAAEPLILKGEWQPAFLDQVKELVQIMIASMEAGIL
jgi:multimeric flavodoxin WrbA